MIYWFTYFGGRPGNFQYSLLLFFVFFFLSISVALFIIILLSIKGRKIQARKDQELKELCEIIITSVMFDEELSEEARELTEDLLLDPREKQFLLNELIDLGKQFTGEVSDRLRDFYQQTGLVKYSIQKLSTHDKKTILTGIEELMEMNVTSSIPTMASLLNTEEDEEIHNYVLLAILNMKPDQGFRYINDADSYLSEWQQLTIISLLDRKNYYDVPYLDKWLNKNESLIIFGCRLIRFTKSLIEIPILTEMVRTSAPAIKIEVIKTLGILEASEVTPLLISIYPHESIVIKEAILEALCRIGSPAALPFLLECAITDPFDLKMIAIRAIRGTEGGTEAIKQLLSLHNLQINKIIRHVSDPRL